MIGGDAALEVVEYAPTVKHKAIVCRADADRDGAVVDQVMVDQVGVIGREVDHVGESDVGCVSNTLAIRLYIHIQFNQRIHVHGVHLTTPKYG